MGGESVSIDIPDPFHPDLDFILASLGRIAVSCHIDPGQVRELILRMIKGIVGCERGCPADARRLTATGFLGFDLQYIEGGILIARAVAVHGGGLCLKMFPDF
jgi:hypothetical protein